MYRHIWSCISQNHWSPRIQANVDPLPEIGFVVCHISAYFSCAIPIGPLSAWNHPKKNEPVLLGPFPDANDEGLMRRFYFKWPDYEPDATDAPRTMPLMIEVFSQGRSCDLARRAVNNYLVALGKGEWNSTQRVPPQQHWVLHPNSSDRPTPRPVWVPIGLYSAGRESNALLKSKIRTPEQQEVRHSNVIKIPTKRIVDLVPGDLEKLPDYFSRDGNMFAVGSRNEALLYTLQRITDMTESEWDGVVRWLRKKS